MSAVLNLTLRPKFINVKPLKRSALNYSTNDWNRIFAYSRFTIQDAKYETFRLISASTPPGVGEGVIIRNLSRAEVNFIPLAEDPRVFDIGGRSFLQYQVFNNQKGDCDLFLRDVNSHVTYQLISPFHLTGKNWSFFDSLSKFACVYSFNPLIFLCGEINEAKKIIEFSVVGQNSDNQLNWGEVGENLIGTIRGGTPFTKIAEHRWLSFTHSTPTGHNREQHTLGCALIDLTDSKIYHLDLTKQRNKLLVDAYGYHKSTESIYVYLSLGSGHPGRKKENFLTSEIEFKTRDLIDKCITDGSIENLDARVPNLLVQAQ
jgi:hypothetical protein